MLLRCTLNKAEGLSAGWWNQSLLGDREGLGAPDTEGKEVRLINFLALNFGLDYSTRYLYDR
jgi:hypothetical protein